MLYNMLFQVEYYEAFLRRIPVPFGATIIEMEQKFLSKNNESEETSSKDVPKPENINTTQTDEE